MQNINRHLITADQHIFSYVDGVEIPNESPSP